MLRWLLLVCVTLAVVFCGSVVPVWADDIYPPSWQRGGPGTTYEGWTFATDANPSAPDEGMYNPYGTPEATVTGGTWSAFYDNHVGVWTLGSSSSIDLFIPNTPRDDTKYKNVQTQLTWDPEFVGQQAPLVVVDGIQSAPVTTYPAGNAGWMQSVYETTLAYNPSSEDIIITGSYDLGEAVIDTQCVPEPSTFALAFAGLATATLLWRRGRA